MANPAKNYRDLIAWQKAMDLATAIYRITESFPKKEQYGLTNQLRRAVVSISSNIAEGQGRGATRDFVRFLCMAKGSLQEVQTQVEIAHRLDFIKHEERETVLASSEEVAKLLNGLIRCFQTKESGQ